MPDRGFTLAELLLVLALLGLIMGIGAVSLDKMDPGSRGLRAATLTFIQSSRDRARGSGKPVTLEVLPPVLDEIPARLVRYAYRRSLEATFETSARQRENLSPVAPAVLGKPGRMGAGLDLAQGGGALVVGRGGVVRAPHGIQVEMDVYRAKTEGSGSLIVWEGLMTLRVRNDGSLDFAVRAGDGKTFARFTLSSPRGSMPEGRWHHLVLAAAAGRMSIKVNGKEVAAGNLDPVLAQPDGSPYLGDSDGKFHGFLDEFTVWTRFRENGPELREDVLLVLDPPTIRFDRHGLLDHSVHDMEVGVALVEYGELVDSFWVGRFTEEMGP